MNEVLVFLAPSVLALLFIQGIKWLWRKFVVKDMEYDFPPNFYKIAIPTLNVLMLPVAAFIDPASNAMPTDWVGFVRTALTVFINSLATVFIYNGGYKPVVEYGRIYKMRKMGLDNTK